MVPVIGHTYTYPVPKPSVERVRAVHLVHPERRPAARRRRSRRTTIITLVNKSGAVSAGGRNRRGPRMKRRARLGDGGVVRRRALASSLALAPSRMSGARAGDAAAPPSASAFVAAAVHAPARRPHSPAVRAPPPPPPPPRRDERAGAAAQRARAREGARARSGRQRQAYVPPPPLRPRARGRRPPRNGSRSPFAPGSRFRPGTSRRGDPMSNDFNFQVPFFVEVGLEGAPDDLPRRVRRRSRSAGCRRRSPTRRGATGGSPLVRLASTFASGSRCRSTSALRSCSTRGRLRARLRVGVSVGVGRGSPPAERERLSGFEFARFGGGVDLRVESLLRLRAVPGARLRHLHRRSISSSSGDDGATRSIANTSLHEWFTLGSAASSSPEAARRSRMTIPTLRPKRVRLHPHGLDLGDEIVPLRAGAMHYWRHPPDEWGAGLDAIRALGFRLVDTYVPWGEHEIAPGQLDFGERDPRLDVARFLRMAHERALKVVLRPGPHINAELTYFGLPERIVWDRACQARTPRDNPVMLPIVPVAFPVPSYASDVFHEETALWFERVGRVVTHLRHPEGPDRARPDRQRRGALLPRRPLRPGLPPRRDRPLPRVPQDEVPARERAPRRLATTRSPPRDRDPPDPLRRHATPTISPRHIDWIEFHEHLLVHAMRRMVEAARGTGLDELPTMHNFPLGEAATPLNAGRMDDVIDLIGLDYYHRATPGRAQHDRAADDRARGALRGAACLRTGRRWGPGFRRSSRRSTRRTRSTPSSARSRTACAGTTSTWPSSAIAGSARRSIRTAASARSPPKYERLNAALDATEFHTLRRRAPVRLVVPRVAPAAGARDARVRADHAGVLQHPRRGLPRELPRRGARARGGGDDGGGGVPARVRAGAPRARGAVRVRGGRQLRREHRGRAAGSSAPPSAA